MFCFVLFLVRKIVPEPTSVPIVWDAAMAWLDEQYIGPHLGSEPENPGSPKQSMQS